MALVVSCFSIFTIASTVEPVERKPRPRELSARERPWAAVHSVFVRCFPYSSGWNFSNRREELHAV